MKRLRSNILSQILSFAAVFLLVIPLNAGSAPAQEHKTKIKHTPFSFFVSENRIKVAADVTDEAGVKIVRCYFRAAGQADYVFVRMESVKEDRYEGILPKPRKDTQMLEYILLAVNQKDQVVKTEVFRVEKKDEKEVPEWQKVVLEGEIKVSTELAKAPETLPGFKDSIVLDVVESAGRFGAAAGIYTLLQSGGTSGTAAATTAATTTSTGGLSGATIAGIAAAAAVVGGGVAIANNDDGDDDNLTLEVLDSPPFYCGESIRFSALKGKEPYIFSVSNSDVSLEDKKDGTAEIGTNRLFNAEGKCPDTVEIKVTDADGHSRQVTVTIQPNVNITLPQ